MIRPALWLLVRWLAGLIAGLALAAGFLVWRLSAGPVSLDYLIPHVAAAIERAKSGIVVHIDHTLISLGEGATIDIVARGVHVGRRGGEAQLTLPELALGLSVRAALTGVAAPTRIIVREPQLRLERAEDGTFHLGFDTETADGGDWAQDLLRELSAAPDRRGPLGFLTRVSIRDAALTVDDRALGVVWRAKRADATLFRGAAGVFGDLTVTVVEPGGKQAELRGDFRQVNGQTRLGLQLSFADMWPAVFADAAPALTPLAALQFPLSGRMRIELDTAALRISDAWCDVSIGGGWIEHAAFVGGGLAFASGVLRAAYDPAKGRVSIERLGFDLGEAKTELTGTVDGLGDGMLAAGWPSALDFAGELRLIDVQVDALAALWPEQLSPRTRSWITEHVHDGTVSQVAARIHARADLTASAGTPIGVDALAGTIAYRNLTLEYFRPLEPLRHVDGTGTFDLTTLDLVPSSGLVHTVQVTGGSAKLSKLDTNEEEIAVDLSVKGPVRDVLEVLDTKPLQYARALKVDPAHAAGEVDGQMHFVFPLKHDLALDMVDYGARGQLSGVAVEQVIAGRDLTAGDLAMKLDRNALHLDGTARLADVPMTLTWNESLKPKDAIRSRYTVKARLDDAARQKLGLELPAEMVQGWIDVDAAYNVFATKRSAASLALGLTDTTLAVAQLNWQKPAGVPATAALDLDFADGNLRAVRPASLKGDRLDVQLGVNLDEAGTVTRVDVARLAAGATNVAGTVTRRSEGGWRFDVRGASLDASVLLKNADASSKGEQTDPALVVDAAVDRLIIGPQREALGVKSQLYSDGVHWQAMSIDFGMRGNGKTSLRFGQAGGDRSFRMSTDDLGALTRLLDISDNVEGGHLDANGQVEDSGRRRVLHGKVDGADYRIVRAPPFAKLLSVASFSGIGALLSGEGIPFSRIKGDFTLAAGKLEVKELRAYGGAIGIRTDGVYDLAAETLDLAGTLVPAYTINSFLGNIPLIGPAIVGEGVFGVNFRVAGPISNVQITVNPLGIVAPGVLRKLFLFDAPAPSAPPPKSGAAQPR
jgi:Protein of unknown function/AsmA-like C-terminal region